MNRKRRHKHAKRRKQQIQTKPNKRAIHNTNGNKTKPANLLQKQNIHGRRTRKAMDRKIRQAKKILR